MTGDVAARLLAVITFAEKLADQVIAESEAYPQETLPFARQVTYSYPERLARSVFDGWHSPAVALRRCAADRKIIAEHAQVDAIRVGEHATGCATCHTNPVSGETIGYGDCTTMLLLAEAYGLAVGEES